MEMLKMFLVEYFHIFLVMFNLGIYILAYPYAVLNHLELKIYCEEIIQKNRCSTDFGYFSGNREEDC